MTSTYYGQDSLSKISRAINPIKPIIFNTLLTLRYLTSLALLSSVLIFDNPSR